MVQRLQEDLTIRNESLHAPRRAGLAIMLTRNCYAASGRDGLKHIESSPATSLANLATGGKVWKTIGVLQ